MILAGRATAQIVLPPVIVGAQRQVNLDSDNWREVAAAGSPVDNQRVVLAALGQRPLVMLEGGSQKHEGPNLLVGDPFVTSVPSSVTTTPGRIYVGGMKLSFPTNQVLFTYHDPADGNDWDGNAISIAVQGINGLPDKPWMAVGPEIGSGLTHYLVSNLKNGCGPTPHHAISRSYSNDAVTWINGSVSPLNPAPMCGAAAGCHYNGWGMLPVILDNGHIVAVVRDTRIDSDGPGCYNDGLPYFIWSINNGDSWLPEGSQGHRLGFPSAAKLHTDIAESVIGDTPHWPDIRHHAPTIAVDRRTSPNLVYVAFAARENDLSPPGPDHNADIWIFRGAYVESQGAYVFPDALRLTEQMLGITPNADGKGPDQWLPAIAIDCGGGINLTFYDNRTETQAPTIPDSQLPSPGRMGDVYYAHISNWPGGTPSVYTKRLTPASFPLKNCGQTDYMTLASAGPNGQRIYPVYIAAKELSPGAWSSGTCYMHQIVVRNCAVDLNLNGLADAPDIEWYLEDFAASLPEADLTTDGMVNSDDLDEFVASYEEMVQP